jgi:hypothetical protein
MTESTSTTSPQHTPSAQHCFAGTDAHTKRAYTLAVSLVARVSRNEMSHQAAVRRTTSYRATGIFSPSQYSVCLSALLVAHRVRVQLATKVNDLPL